MDTIIISFLLFVVGVGVGYGFRGMIRRKIGEAEDKAKDILK